MAVKAAKHADDIMRVDSAHRSRAAVAPKPKGASKALRPITITFVTLLAAGVDLGVLSAMHAEREETIDDGFHAASPWIRWLILIGSSLLAWILWQRRWRIVDTPTVEVAGAHPGVCEMHGTIRTTRPVQAWVTGTPCVAYEATMTKKSGKNTVTLWSRTEIAPDAWLDDGTGAVRVDVAHLAKKTRRSIHREGIGSGRTMSETALVDGDEVYILATVRIDSDGQLIVRKDQALGEPSGGRLKKIFLSRLGGESRARSVTLLGALVTSVVAVITAVSLVVLSSWSKSERGSDGKTHTYLRLVPRVMHPAVAGLTAAAIIAAVLLVAYLIRWWNRFVAVRNEVTYASSFIDTTVQLRHDLIGQLLPGVAAAATHELATVGARLRADAPQRAMVAARIEQYPQLTSDAVFAHLFGELVRCENRVAAARRYYNDAVTLCRDRASQFPAVLVARLVFPSGLPELLDFDLEDIAPPGSVLEPDDGT